MSILFLHGLEGSPEGRKSTFLRHRYQAETPELDTRAARELLAQWTPSRSPSQSDRDQIFELPIETALVHLNTNTQLVIGSSFGGAILGEMVHRRLWAGPCIFLAGAHAKLSAISSLRGPSVSIHGSRDTVVLPEPVRRLTNMSGKSHEFWLVDDDHRLHTILSDGTLARAIDHLAGL